VELQATWHQKHLHAQCKNFIYFFVFFNFVDTYFEVIKLNNRYDNMPGYGKEVDMWACGVILYTL
jgi:hypothetical protein